MLKVIFNYKGIETVIQSKIDEIMVEVLKTINQK